MRHVWAHHLRAQTTPECAFQGTGNLDRDAPRMRPPATCPAVTTTSGLSSLACTPHAAKAPGMVVCMTAKTASSHVQVVETSDHHGRYWSTGAQWPDGDERRQEETTRSRYSTRRDELTALQRI
jgi:hypothetical protein